MRTIHVNLSETCDASQAFVRFEERYRPRHAPDAEGMIQEVRSALIDLDRRGKELRAMGISFNAARTIELPATRVEISARYGVPAGGTLFGWFRHRSRRRCGGA